MAERASVDNCAACARLAPASSMGAIESPNSAFDNFILQKLQMLCFEVRNGIARGDSPARNLKKPCDSDAPIVRVLALLKPPSCLSHSSL
jgi:hypothetical protein